MDEAARKSDSEGSLQSMRSCNTYVGLRPVLLSLLQTGGVPHQMAEGIADILEEAGYQDFRPTDEVALRCRKARMLKSTTPDTFCDTLYDVSTKLVETPETKAMHRRIVFERIAAHNHTQDRMAPFLLTQDMRA